MLCEVHRGHVARETKPEEGTIPEVGLRDRTQQRGRKRTRLPALGMAKVVEHVPGFFRSYLRHCVLLSSRAMPGVGVTSHCEEQHDEPRRTDTGDVQDGR